MTRLGLLPESSATGAERAGVKLGRVEKRRGGVAKGEGGYLIYLSTSKPVNEAGGRFGLQLVMSDHREAGTRQSDERGE